MRRIITFVSLAITLMLPTVGVRAADSGYAAGVKLYQSKDYRGAVAQFEKVVKASPRDANALYYCALSNQAIGNRARARQLYEYISSAFPGSQVANMAAAGLQKLGGSSAGTTGSRTGAVTGAASGLGGDGFHDDVDYVQAVTPTADLGRLPSEFRVPFERRNGGVYIDTSVNGHHLTMHLDTGAPDTVLGANHLEALGVTSSAKGRVMDGQSGVGERKHVKMWEAKVDFKVGPAYRKNFPVIVQDHLQGDPLLGQTFLSPFYVTIDEDSRQVVFRKKTSASLKQVTQARADASIPFYWDNGHMIVQALVNNRPCEMIFDTGADGICFTPKIMKKLNIEMPDNAQQETHIGTGGETRGWGFYLDKIKVGPLIKENIKVSSVESSNMSRPLLGQEFFSNYKITIDNEHKRILFSNLK